MAESLEEEERKQERRDKDEDEDTAETQGLDLYEQLGVTHSSTSDEIKRAYRRLALKHHPDKLAHQGLTPSELAHATTVFQSIGYAYSVLGDEGKRKRYDLTGSSEEGEGWGGEGFDWNDLFKTLWTGEVNGKTLDEFKEKYQGSQEEKEDMFDSYRASKGSLDAILDSVPCSEITDEPRIIQIIESAITEKKLPRLKEWTRSSGDQKAKKKRMNKAAKESKEAEELAKELGLHDDLFGKKDKRSREDEGTKGGDDGFSGLRAIIAKRQENRAKEADIFLDHLTEKYASKSKSKKKTKTK